MAAMIEMTKDTPIWKETIIYRFLLGINTSYLTDSYIVFTLKMESVSKNTIFGKKWWWKVV